MPEKQVMQSSISISHYVGLIGSVLGVIGTLIGIKIKSIIKKDEQQQEEINRQKKTNEEEYRKKIEEALTTIWKRIDECKAKVDKLGEQLACLEGRFEDLQRAHLRLTCQKLMKDNDK